MYVCEREIIKLMPAEHTEQHLKTVLHRGHWKRDLNFLLNHIPLLYMMIIDGKEQQETIFTVIKTCTYLGFIAYYIPYTGTPFRAMILSGVSDDKLSRVFAPGQQAQVLLGHI